MKYKEVNSFLQDLSFNSTFRFLDEGSKKDKETLLEVAKSCGLVLPAYDLAVFECLYGFVDKQNRNGCTLPKEEVEKAITTLRGKSIDIDHNRKTVVGFWLDGKIDGNKIIAYGAIWKGSFEEDYQIVKELFDRGNLAISFEAWGNRVPNGEKDGGYDLTDIEFAGGALLVKTEPAFDGAGVLEMAKSKVLEFASTLSAPKSFVRDERAVEVDKIKNLFKSTDTPKKPDVLSVEEAARLYHWDTQDIIGQLRKVTCPSCDSDNTLDPTAIDYVNATCQAECQNCGSMMHVNLIHNPTLTKKGKKIKSMERWAKSYSLVNPPDQTCSVATIANDPDMPAERASINIEEAMYPYPRIDVENRSKLTDDDFAIVKSFGEKDKEKKLRILPIHDLAHIKLASVVVNTKEAIEMLDKLGVTKDMVDSKIKRKVVTLAMKKLMEKYQKASAVEAIQAYAKEKVGRELTEAELEKAYSLVALKATGTGSDQSLLQMPAGHSKWSNQSIMSVTLSDNDYAKMVESEGEPAHASADADKVAEVQKKLDEANAKLADVSAKLAKFEEAKAAEEAAKKAELVKARKEELGDLAKDWKDEDFLDEGKYTIAKKDKEIAELKAAAEKGAKKPDLSKGAAKGKDGQTDQETPEQASRRRVSEKAFSTRYTKPVDEK